MEFHNIPIMNMHMLSIQLIYDEDHYHYDDQPMTEQTKSSG